MESWDFLTELGLDLPALGVSMITQLQVSSARGTLLQRKLPLGGFGISRFRLDHELVKIARQAGVTVREKTKVNEVTFTGNGFMMDAGGQPTQASVVAGCYGKRSNLDIKWNRSFIAKSRSRFANYIGVKYHIRSGLPADTIALHNFPGGYCGVVKIEEDLYNLCYLTTAANLQRSGGHIRDMEKMILSRNPRLERLLKESDFGEAVPLTISQISFDKKTQVENHVIMTGDAAGMVTPLCGNGMSMALHGSKIAAAGIHAFLNGEITREQMERRYAEKWREQFGRRLQAGRFLQPLMNSTGISSLFLTLIRPFPGLFDRIVRQTHGKSF